MDELWRLREWLTVDEAATHLSTLTGRKIAEPDILRLALDGFLTLAVNLPAGADARCCEIGTADDGVVEDGPEQTKHIDGLWDLSLTGAGRREVESWYHRLRHLPSLNVDGTTGAIVERPGMYCLLRPERGYSGISSRRGSALPDDTVIVVRVAALVELAARLGAASTPASTDLEKPFETRERATLLTIIAALARAAKIDITQTSKAGSTIAAITQELGAPVSTRAVEEHLKRVPDALERRRNKS